MSKIWVGIINYGAERGGCVTLWSTSQKLGGPLAPSMFTALMMMILSMPLSSQYCLKVFMRYVLPCTFSLEKSGSYSVFNSTFFCSISSFIYFSKLLLLQLHQLLISSALCYIFFKHHCLISVPFCLAKEVAIWIANNKKLVMFSQFAVIPLAQYQFSRILSPINGIC